MFMLRFGSVRKNLHVDRSNIYRYWRCADRGDCEECGISGSVLSVPSRGQALLIGMPGFVDGGVVKEGRQGTPCL